MLHTHPFPVKGVINNNLAGLNGLGDAHLSGFDPLLGQFQRFFDNRDNQSTGITYCIGKEPGPSTLPNKFIAGQGDLGAIFKAQH